MKRIFSLLILCMAVLTASAVMHPKKGTERPWKNGRLMVSSNHRFLQHKNGTPFFWLGDTGWLLPERLDRAEAQYYMEQLAAAEYNVVQVQVMDDTPSYNVYGQPSMTDGWNFDWVDRQKGVYGYWDHLDYIISQAERNGIYVGMVAIWGSQVKSGKIDADGARKYGEFLANRYKDRPNIIWIMGGDIQGTIHPEVWEAMATTIRSIDHNHLMTYHPRGRCSSAQYWAGASWIDLHTYQSGHRKYGQRMDSKDYPIADNTEEDTWMYVDTTWTHDPTKPVIDSEPIYENIPKGLHDPDEERWQAADVRRYAYWDVFAGCCGHTYGHNSIMQMLKPGYPTAYGRNGEEPMWYEALRAPGFQQMKYLKRLMLMFPYFDRVPDQSVIVDNGTKYDRLIATRGNDYLMVYNYSGIPMKIDLRKVSGDKKRVYWYDVQTGAMTPVGEFDNKVVTFNRQNPGRVRGTVSDGVLIAVDSGKYPNLPS